MPLVFAFLPRAPVRCKTREFSVHTQQLYKRLLFITCSHHPKTNDEDPLLLSHKTEIILVSRWAPVVLSHDGMMA
jgi:hypothetical protein